MRVDGSAFVALLSSAAFAVACADPPAPEPSEHDPEHEAAVVGAVRTAASCEQKSVQDMVDLSSDGDTVNVPRGNCTWNGAVRIVNRSVKVIGAGKLNTVITCETGCFYVESNVGNASHSAWRLSGMTVQGSAPGTPPIQVWDNNLGAHYGFRIDHMKISFPGGARSGYGIMLGGPMYGVIDHNEIHWGNGMAIIISAQLATEYLGTAPANWLGAYVLSQPLDLGTKNAVYMEDNTFTSTVPGGCAAYDTSSGGGRAVFRHNTLSGCMYYDHWNRATEVGGVLHEIYGNKFIGVPGVYDLYPIRLESGTGVIFNNTIVGMGNKVVLDERRAFVEAANPMGACDGSKKWDGNAGDPAAPGWPCLNQIGRAPGKTLDQIITGQKQVSAPLYLWNNGTQDGCLTGVNCTSSTTVEVYDGSTKARAYVRATPHPNGEVDYVLNGNTPKPGYVPFTYPHPLAVEAAPAAPVVTSALSATGTVGAAFSYQISATNNPTSYAASPLPPGLAVNATTGAITGKPTVAGTTSVVLTARNATGTGTATLTVRVASSFNVAIGETGTLTIPDGGNQGLILAQQATLSTAATLRTLQFFVSTASGSLRLGLYDASGANGMPGKKLAETLELTPVQGWNTVAVQTPISLAPGTYWLAHMTTTNALQYPKGMTGLSVWSPAAYGPMPVTFPLAGVGSDVVHWSMNGILSVP